LATSTTTPADRPELHLVEGPRAAEAALLQDLTAHLAGQSGTWDDPLVIVVPSRSLRDHLQGRIVASVGSAVLGVRCTTLFGAALELTEDVSGHLLSGSDLFPLFARRLARGEKPLHRALEPLSDGYSALLGPLRDLLDAGLDPAHGEAIVEALESEGRASASAAEVRRAQALVRVAAGTVEALDGLGVGRRSTLLSTAARTVREAQGLPLAARSIWVHGFADATGVATDLIEALLETSSGRLYLDQPPDPVGNNQPDAGVVFTRRFRERLETRCSGVERSITVDDPEFEIFRALGTDGEVREVVRRIRELTDGGTTPESISVVARQLSPYGRALRTHFRNLGVPYSCYGGQGTRTRVGRRAEALAELLSRGERLAIDRWLGLVDLSFGGRSRADLRTGLATLGTGRLEEAAALVDDEYRLSHDLKLKVRQGFSEVFDETGESRGIFLRHRTIPAEALKEASGAANRLVLHLAQWRSATTREAHEQLFSTLLEEHLGWKTDSPEAILASAAADTWSALDPESKLSFDEFVEIVAPRLTDLGNEPLGGQGGGVQVLDVVEARGRTSEHLYVMGLNRGLFPRIVREDPLLPDALRNVISRQGFGLLPDLNDKLGGFDEERFLFAQLLASSPRVTLSWQETDDDQLPLAPSPLLERLRWVRDDDVWRDPPLARPITAQAGSAPRSPLENGLAVALAGSRDRLGRVLPHLLTDGETAASAKARARAAVLAEQDPRGPEATHVWGQLGPYFGFVGEASDEDPRRAQRLYVTALERLTGCPWQAFLERVLRLAPVPDPLAALPGITPLLIGSLVHSVLEEIAGRGLTDPPSTLEQARHRIPAAAPWPEADELDAILFRTSESLCRREGIAVRGFPRVLALAVAPFLDEARRLDWQQAGGLHVLGVEIEGQLSVADLRGSNRPIYFRADRLDLDNRGMVLSDYKTGRRPVSKAKQARWRRKHLVQSVRKGERLQAVAYALAAGQEGDSGRYVFLHPDLGDERDIRDARIAGDDEELRAAFESAAAAALATWDAGSFFPRVVEPDKDDEPFRCVYCEVRDACQRGDSGARRRLAGWAEERRGQFVADGTLSAEELTFLTLWQLPAGDGP